MKLEIIEEKKYSEGAWYCVKVDGVAVKYSRIFEEIEKIYQEIKDNPEVLKEKINVLKSEEIFVDLQEKN
jgi:hypothetical protein